MISILLHIIFDALLMIILDDFVDLYKTLYNRTIEVDPVAKRPMSTTNILMIIALVLICLLGLLCVFGMVIRRFRKRGKHHRSKFVRNSKSKLTRVQATPVTPTPTPSLSDSSQ